MKPLSSFLAQCLLLSEAGPGSKGQGHEKFSDQQEPVLLLLAQAQSWEKESPSGNKRHREECARLRKGSPPEIGFPR